MRRDAAAVRPGECLTAAIINEHSRIRNVSNSLQSFLGGQISSCMTHLNTKRRAEVEIGRKRLHASTNFGYARDRINRKVRSMCMKDPLCVGMFPHTPD